MPIIENYLTAKLITKIDFREGKKALEIERKGYKKMRYDEVDLQVQAVMWYGVDKNGYIFVCHSSWMPNIPEFVCRSKEETECLENYFMEYIGISEYDWGEVDFYIEKGISYFDVITDDIPPIDKDFATYPYWYREWIHGKSPLLHFDQLPKNIQEIMDSHRIDIDITKDKYFYVEDAFDRGKNRQKEKILTR